MPRIARGLGGGGVAHVLSRGNARATVFHSPREYDDFVGLLDEARRRSAVELLAFCVMPNHFHLVARVDDSASLSEMMQWWLTSHVRRQHKRNATSGHIWQGRFKSFPVQEDRHLLTVLRYVLLNPCRAGLAAEPWEWRWSSLRHARLVAPWPVLPPGALADWLGAPCREEENDEVKQSILRSAPLGDEAWREAAARAWGLESTLRPRGRPRNGWDPFAETESFDFH
jgi:putative transposase